MVKLETIEDGLKMMNMLLKSGPKEITGHLVAIWGKVFTSWTDEMFLRACSQLVETSTFFPAPAELFNLEKISVEGKSTLAWESIRECIGRYGTSESLHVSDLNGDGAALWALSRMGLEELGMMTSDNRSIKAAEFRRLYSAANAQNLSLDYLPGTYEKQNKLLGIEMKGRPELCGRGMEFLTVLEQSSTSQLPENGLDNKLAKIMELKRIPK
jgi:hypothetical protein